MATTRKWVAPAAIATALTTELNNLANERTAPHPRPLTTARRCTRNIWFEVYLGSLTPTAGGYIGIYIIRHGRTNYATAAGRSHRRRTCCCARWT